MGALGTFEIDEESVAPIWIQIRRRIIYLIESGQFAENTKIPSVRELSVDLGVNYNTVNKVYQDLERDGYTKTRRGLGTFVAPGKRVRSTEDGELQGMIASFVSLAVEKGMTADEIVEYVREYVDSYDG